jgi:hypothetical protein
MENNNQPPVSTPTTPQMPVEPAVSPSKSNLLVISLIILEVVTLLVAGYFAYQFSQLKKQTVEPQNTTSNSTLPTNEVATNPQIPKGAGKVAYRMGGTVNEGGDIWVSNSDGTGKQKLTSSGHIGWLYSWSPDNKFILASTNEVSQNFVKTNYVAVDSQSGVETTIPITKGMSRQGNSDFVWTGNKEITYIDENVIYKITVGGQNIEVNRVPTEAQANGYSFNKNATKIAFDNGGPDMPGNTINVFSYDLVTKQKNQISEGGNAYILGWAGENVIYQQNKGLWSSSPDGKTKNKLADLNEWFILGDAISPDSSRILYTADNRGSGSPNQGKIFVFDYKLGKVTEIATLNDNNFASNLSISRDATFGGYTLSGIVNAPSVSVDLSSSKSTKLCEASCYYPIWQN